MEPDIDTGPTGMPQLDFTIWPNLIFWLLVTLVVLYLILSRVALPRIASVLAERQDSISSDLERAALFKRRAEQAEAAYQKALADARAEAERIAADMRAKVQKQVDRATAKADAEIAARAAESEERLRAIRDSALENTELVARDTARAIVAAVAPGLAAESRLDRAITERLKG